MRRRARTFLLVSAVAAMLAACDSSTEPEQSQEPEGPPWEYPDSAYKVIENLEYAYNTLDLELYMSCFRYDFEFSGLISPDTSSWGYETEGVIHENMFGTVYGNDLDFEGSTEWPWSGDSTGESRELQRTFDLDVYMNEYEGFRASGIEIFICRPDGDGAWYVWQWFDQSETDENVSWIWIKQQFLW